MRWLVRDDRRALQRANVGRDVVQVGGGREFQLEIHHTIRLARQVFGFHDLEDLVEHVWGYGARGTDAASAETATSACTRRLCIRNASETHAHHLTAADACIHNHSP